MSCGLQVRSPGGGDNLYLSSIVALRPDNGDMVWWYQTTPGDTWDYTATQHIMLLDLKIAGEDRKVLVQAPKNGFFYVIDRETGEFVSAEKYVTATWAERIDRVNDAPRRGGVHHPVHHQRRGGQLGLVGLPALRHAHRVRLRPVVAPHRRDDRRRVLRGACMDAWRRTRCQAPLV